MKIIVAEVKDHEGKICYEALDANQMDEKKKELMAAYRDALKQYNELSGDAKANAKKPCQPSMKSKKTFADLDEAAKCAMELQKKLDEKDKE